MVCGGGYDEFRSTSGRPSHNGRIGESMVMLAIHWLVKALAMWAGCIAAIALLFKAADRYGFVAQLKRDGRWLTWKEVETRCDAGACTLIVCRITSDVWFDATNTFDNDCLYNDVRENAFLTNCPRSLATAEQLKNRFPQCRIVICNRERFTLGN